MPKKTKKNNSIRPVVLTIVGIFLLAIIWIAIYFSGILNTTSINLNSQSIKNEQREARNVAEAGFDSVQANQISALYNAGVINSPTPTYSAKVDYCYFTSQKKDKFNTINWSQGCSLRYFDILETSLTRDEILQKLALSADVPSTFGEPYLYNLGEGGKCDPIYRDTTNSSSSLTFLDWSRDKNLSCKIYDPSKNNTTNFGPNTFKTIRSYSIESVDRKKSYLYIGEDNNYFDKSLGCGSKGLFGCSEPISEPITDF